MSGAGNGPVDAFINALNAEFSSRFGEIEIRHYEQRSLTQGSNSQAIALIEIATRQGTTYGIGIHANIVAASFNAIISALNRNAIASESAKSQTNLAAIGN